MLNDRLVQTFLLATIGLVVMGLLGPGSPDPQEEVLAKQTAFFINKAHQTEKFDMVIVGDSRALRGLSPAEISKQLPDVSIFNFAFNAGGMNVEMYDEADKLLQADSSTRSVLLVPTSLAFMLHKTSNSQFREYRLKPKDQAWLYQNAPAVANFFQSLSPSVFLRRWFDLKPQKFLTQEFTSDGWLATEQTPRDDVTNLHTQREILASHKIDPGLISEFMAKTKAWTNDGTNVFALFPPAYEPRAALEDSLLDFDKAAFRLAFVQAGGIWLDPTEAAYVTYDGSHLEKASALEFSRQVGISLAQQMQNLK